jgi:hypothetical protein
MKEEAVEKQESPFVGGWRVEDDSNHPTRV